ncbi:MAG TPA: endopeptidase La [Saprospiraceae bacterium]|jgi:ATP-dependent Lon protease
MFEDILVANTVAEESEFMPIISVDEDDEPHNGEDLPELVPVLALKNTVLYPGIVIPITVGREKSMKAVRKAHDTNKQIAVLAQRDIDTEDPDVNDLFKVGTMARILKILKMPDGSITAILQGRSRINLVQMDSVDPYMLARVKSRNYIPAPSKIEFEAIIGSIRDLAEKIIKLSPNIPSEAVVMIRNIKSDIHLLGFIASNLGVDNTKKQELLEIEPLDLLASEVFKMMHNELQMLEIKSQLESKVRVDIEKQQRDYFLNQQLKTIQEELGQNPQETEIRNLVERSKKKKWSKVVQDTFDREIAKVRRINPQVAEYSLQLNYLELLLDLPWEHYTKDNFDLKNVQKVLDEDHHGLEEVKDRILEHLAVLKLKGDMKAPILCLVGPPGVGKTSLGKSIARALKRKFIRMSLGGLHDESEIRGHRKTYIGAMPGRIIQSVKKAGASNPVFILDEIDKVGKDFRGDPSSALLEVLDPEQNSTFYDNYLELEYDLSKVMFVATANSLNTIQPALLDRMEVINISGYSTEEKIEIAKKHLIPRQRKEHGLKPVDVKLKDDVLREMAESYTRESGVRSLDRRLASVMRHVAKKVAMDEKYNVSITKSQLGDILGPDRVDPTLYTEVHSSGVAIGLAWTKVGGDILFIESSLSPGKGKLTLTGNLGDVMKESATTALSFIKAHGDVLGIDAATFENTDIHIHVPEGAIPKDGPSAGITMLTALASAFKKKPVKSHLAMTGEITLRGKVLPVGGIKEKVLAAKRAGIKHIILSTANKRHIEQIKPEYIQGVKFIFVDKMEEVLQQALDIWSF